MEFTILAPATSHVNLEHWGTLGDDTTPQNIYNLLMTTFQLLLDFLILKDEISNSTLSFRCMFGADNP